MEQTIEPRKFVDSGADTLKVEAKEYAAWPGAYLKIKGKDFYLSKGAAPEVVLAILEAAGWTDEVNLDAASGTGRGHVAKAVSHLREAVRRDEQAEKERKDEDAARVLFNSLHGFPLEQPWPATSYKTKWVSALTDMRRFEEEGK